MNPTTKAALIVAAAILIGVAAYIYFSPYQECVRAHFEQNRDWARSDPNGERNAARMFCARGVNSN
jgi:hypothetical protein